MFHCFTHNLHFDDLAFEVHSSNFEIHADGADKVLRKSVVLWQFDKSYGEMGTARSLKEGKKRYAFKN